MVVTDSLTEAQQAALVELTISGTNVVQCHWCGRHIVFPEESYLEKDGTFACERGGECNEVRVTSSL